LRSYMDVVAVLLRVELQIFGVRLHRGRIAVAGLTILVYVI